LFVVVEEEVSEESVGPVDGFCEFASGELCGEEAALCEEGVVSVHLIIAV
jgi:hypothetical protein